jgi:RNA polymerase sigma-70 factor (ECF subfamily)
MDFLPIWQQYEPALLDFLRKQLPDQASAEDVLQLTYLKASQNWNQLEQSQKAKAWLMQITRHSLIDFFRKGKKEQVLRQKLATETLAPLANDWNELQVQLARYIPTAIELLPKKYRDAIRLTELEGLSQKELAQQLGISYSGAKSRVQRGREKLKEIILDCCEVEADKYGNIIACAPR